MATACSSHAGGTFPFKGLRLSPSLPCTPEPIQLSKSLVQLNCFYEDEPRTLPRHYRPFRTDIPLYLPHPCLHACNSARLIESRRLTSPDAFTLEYQGFSMILAGRPAARIGRNFTVFKKLGAFCIQFAPRMALRCKDGKIGRPD